MHARLPIANSPKSCEKQGPQKNTRASTSRGVKSPLWSSRFQTSLKINQPGDRYEQEAARVADQVMRMSEPQVQRQSIPAKNEGGGQPLDPATRAFMESRFGHNFSQVRVHTNAQAVRSARTVNALAYTVGSDIAFAENQYAPSTTNGRRLIAHELTHVIQQSGAGSDPMIQRQTSETDIEKKPPEKNEVGEVVVEGLKTVAEQAKDNNPKVKKVIIEPIKDLLNDQWNRLSPGDKAATVSFGAATLGMAGGAMLSDPGGRKQLEGLNLAAPFTLIPYMPLSSFKYMLPSGESPDKRLFTFETSFKADDLINLYTERHGLPKMSLGAHLQWGYDPATERLTVLGGNATLGLVPGLSLSAGAYKDVLRPSPTLIDTEGQMTQIKKSLPELDKPQPVPDVRIMLNVDLMKFKPRDLVRQIHSFFR